jgi:hypothetical protein
MFLFALRKSNYKIIEKRFCFSSGEGKMINQNSSNYHIYSSLNEMNEELEKGWTRYSTPTFLSSLYFLPDSIIVPLAMVLLFYILYSIVNLIILFSFFFIFYVLQYSSK